MLLLSTTALCAVTSPAFAQAAAADANDRAVGEIVVTASRYEQSLQDTPIAVSALGGEALDNQGIVRAEDLSGVVPSLQIGTNGVNGAADIGIRGISSRNVNAYSGAPTVAVHIDGVYVPRPVAMQQALYDIQRVEVLRGPQGTLYGRNATAGVINVITSKPTHERTVSGDVTVGNYDTLRANAVLNVPITSRWAVRAVAMANTNKGYINTLGTTRDRGSKAEQYGLRLTSLVDLTDKLSWTLSGDLFRDQGTPNVPFAVPVPGTLYPAANGFSPWKRPMTTAHNPELDVEAYNIRSNLRWALSPSLTASYVAGWGWLDNYNFTDYEGLPIAGGTSTFIDQNKNQSHEVNITYATPKLQAVVGAIYTNEQTEGTLLVDAITPTGLQFQFPHLNFRQSSYGAFTQATYSVTDRLRLTGGLRYSYDKAESPESGQLVCNLDTPAFALAPPCRRFTPYNEQPNHWDKISWRAGADFDATENVMLYGSVSTGYKQGQLNRGVFPEVQPETVTSYEAGFKSRLFDRSVTLNASTFYMNYSNLQVSQVVLTAPGVTQNLTTNAAKASIRGIEVEGAWRMTRNDTLTGYVALVRSKYDKFSGTIDSVVDPGNLNPLDLSGNDLVRSPRFTARANYEHVFDLANGATLTPMVSFYYSSSYYLREFNQPFDRQKSFTQTDLRLTYQTASKNYAVEAFVQNLEKAKVIQAMYTAPPFLQAFYGAPRTYGVKVSFRR